MQWYYLTFLIVHIVCVVVIFLDRRKSSNLSERAIIVLIWSFLMFWIGVVFEVVRVLARFLGL